MEISRKAPELVGWDFGSLTGQESFQGKNGSASWMRLRAAAAQALKSSGQRGQSD